ncbi:hypothetical protein C8J57DRAFT_1524624 [Mycena rebaudengoi]|nr:hypothetical protein C8J57DRAFT_1524624 [Mycena rebaudengoi]
MNVPPSEPIAFQAMLGAPIRNRRSRAVLAVPTAAELQLARDAERDFAPQLRELGLEVQTLRIEGEYEAQMAMVAADDEAPWHAEAREDASISVKIAKISHLAADESAGPRKALKRGQSV